MQGQYSKLTELKTRNQFKNQPIGDTGLVDADGLIKIKIHNELETNKIEAE